MPLISNTGGGGGSFELPPTKNATMTIANVFYIGQMATDDGGSLPYLAFVFELNPESFGRKSDGSPFSMSCKWAATLGDRAYLKKFLTWSDVKITKEDFKRGFEVSDVRHCLVGLNVGGRTVTYKKKDGGEGWDVKDIAQLPEGMPRVELEADYHEPDGLVKYWRRQAIDSSQEPWIVAESTPGVLGTAHEEVEMETAPVADDSQPF